MTARRVLLIQGHPDAVVQHLLSVEGGAHEMPLDVVLHVKVQGMLQQGAEKVGPAGGGSQLEQREEAVGQVSASYCRAEGKGVSVRGSAAGG